MRNKLKKFIAIITIATLAICAGANECISAGVRKCMSAEVRERAGHQVTRSPGHRRLGIEYGVWSIECRDKCDSSVFLRPSSFVSQSSHIQLPTSYVASVFTTTVLRPRAAMEKMAQLPTCRPLSSIIPAELLKAWMGALNGTDRLLIQTFRIEIYVGEKLPASYEDLATHEAGLIRIYLDRPLGDNYALSVVHMVNESAGRHLCFDVAHNLRGSSRAEAILAHKLCLRMYKYCAEILREHIDTAAARKESIDDAQIGKVISRLNEMLSLAAEGCKSARRELRRYRRPSVVKGGKKEAKEKKDKISGPGLGVPDYEGSGGSSRSDWREDAIRSYGDRVTRPRPSDWGDEAFVSIEANMVRAFLQRMHGEWQEADPDMWDAFFGKGRTNAEHLYKQMLDKKYRITLGGVRDALLHIFKPRDPKFSADKFNLADIWDHDRNRPVSMGHRRLEIVEEKDEGADNKRQQKLAGIVVRKYLEPIAGKRGTERVKEFLACSTIAQLAPGSVARILPDIDGDGESIDYKARGGMTKEALARLIADEIKKRIKAEKKKPAKAVAKVRADKKEKPKPAIRCDRPTAAKATLAEYEVYLRQGAEKNVMMILEWLPIEPSQYRFLYAVHAIAALTTDDFIVEGKDNINGRIDAAFAIVRRYQQRLIGKRSNYERLSIPTAEKIRVAKSVVDEFDAEILQGLSPTNTWTRGDRLFSMVLCLTQCDKYLKPFESKNIAEELAIHMFVGNKGRPPAERARRLVDAVWTRLTGGHGSGRSVSGENKTSAIPEGDTLQIQNVAEERTKQDI